MAVYTDISEVELGRLPRDYRIGELYSYKGIAEGVENSNFLLHAESGAYILTLYEKRVNRDDLPFFLALMQHLASRGISCPQPVAQRNGAAIGEVAGRPAAIVTFLEGMWMRRPTVEHCRAVGVALASMHLAGARLCPASAKMRCRSAAGAPSGRCPGRAPTRSSWASPPRLRPTSTRSRPTGRKASRKA